MDDDDFELDTDPSQGPEPETPEIVFEDDPLVVLEDEESNLDTEGSSAHYENIMHLFDPEELKQLGVEVITNYQVDLDSRSEWESQCISGLQKLGISGNTPSESIFDGGCDVEHPIILESIISYQSKTSTELLPAQGPVRTQIMGQASPEKQKQALRVQRHMNWLLTENIAEYIPETEKLLFFVPMVGNGFKKKTICPIEGRIKDSFVMPSNVVVNSGASSLKTAERISNRVIMPPRLFNRYMATGVFARTDSEIEFISPYEIEYSEFEIVLNATVGISLGTDPAYELIEQQCYLPVSVGSDSKFKIESDATTTSSKTDFEYLPFTVTVDKQSSQLVSIRRNWASWDANKKRRVDFITHYQFVPNGNFYAFGFIHLLGNLQKTLTNTLRSLMDAGQFANLRAGFKRAGLKIADDDVPLSPGEFRDIQTHGDIAAALHILDFKEPSPVLFEIFKSVEQGVRQFADSTQNIVSNSTNYGPVGTTMALLEASAKFFGAIHKRAHHAQEDELRIISHLNFEFLEDFEKIDMPEGVIEIQRSDYDPTRVRVRSVSDPNKPSQAQRVSMAQSKLQAALQAPNIHDLKKVYKEFYMALDPETAEDLFIEETQPTAQDPMSDIETALKGKPIAAFEGQDHNAHVAVKMAWLQNPEQGASQVMASLVPTILANVREHQFAIFKAQVSALEAQGFDQAQAAQEIAEMVQLKKEAEAKGSPAAMIAQAELLKAETDAKAEIRKAQEAQVSMAIKAMDSATRQSEAQIRAKKAEADIDFDRAKLAGDFMKEGLQEVSQVVTRKGT